MKFAGGKVVAGVYGAALVAVVAGIGWYLDTTATDLPSFQLDDQTAAIYIFADRPGVVPQLDWELDADNRVSLVRHPTNNASSDAATLTLVLDSAARFTNFVVDDSRYAYIQNDSVKVENYGDNKEVSNECQIILTDCGNTPFQVLIFGPVAPYSSHGSAHRAPFIRGVLGNTAEPFYAVGGGTRLARGPTMRSYLGLSINRPGFDSRALGLYRVGEKHTNLRIQLDQRDAELISQFFPQTATLTLHRAIVGNLHIQPYVGWSVDQVDRKNEAAFTDGTFASWTSPPDQARAQRNLLLSGTLFGIVAAVVVEVGIQGIRHLASSRSDTD